MKSITIGGLLLYCVLLGYSISGIIGCVDTTTKKPLVIQENKKILYQKDSIIEVNFAAVEIHKVDYFRNDTLQVDIQRWVKVDWPDSVFMQPDIIRIKNKNGKWTYYSSH